MDHLELQHHGFTSNSREKTRKGALDIYPPGHFLSTLACFTKYFLPTRAGALGVLIASNLLGHSPKDVVHTPSLRSDNLGETVRHAPVHSSDFF